VAKLQVVVKYQGLANANQTVEAHPYWLTLGDGFSLKVPQISSHTSLGLVSACTLEVTHFEDIPAHTPVQHPFLFIRTPKEVFICAVLFRIKCVSHLNTIVATGNATLYLVAFLSTDNSTPKPVRCKKVLRRPLVRTEQQQTICFYVSIGLS
jgi:hypothetical protein